MIAKGLSQRDSIDAGWSSLVARRAHNPKVVGSNPAPATNNTSPVHNGDVNKKKPLFRGFFVCETKTLNSGLSCAEKLASVASRDQQIQQLLEPTVEALGFLLWGIEYLSQGKHTLLRIYIEHEDGISIENCAAVSEQVSSVLDVEDPITGEYTLEVSSPGMDRLLFQLTQYPAYVGEIIELRLRSAFEGRRKFKGILKGIEGEDVVVQVDNHEYLLPHSAIEKARVQPRI